MTANDSLLLRFTQQAEPTVPDCIAVTMFKDSPRPETAGISSKANSAEVLTLLETVLGSHSDATDALERIFTQASETVAIRNLSVEQKQILSKFFGIEAFS